MTLEERIERLEQHNRFLKAGLGILLLGVVAVGVFGRLGAAGVQSAAADEMTLRKLVIVDDEGRTRIVAGNYRGNFVGISHYDLDDQVRITTLADSNGAAEVTHYDEAGMIRVHTTTLTDGSAGIDLCGEDGRQRIGAATMRGGRAGVNLWDTERRIRIRASTMSDGTAEVGIKDVTIEDE